MNFLKTIILISLMTLIGCSNASGLLKNSITMDKNASLIDKKGITWEFNATEPLSEEVAFLKSEPNITNKLSDILAGGFHVIPGDNYTEFKEIEKSGRCPAAFLNETASLYLIITDKTSVANKLKNCKEGELLNLSGYFVDVTMSKDGTELPDVTYGDNINFIYLDNISK